MSILDPFNPSGINVPGDAPIIPVEVDPLLGSESELPPAPEPSVPAGGGYLAWLTHLDNFMISSATLLNDLPPASTAGTLGNLVTLPVTKLWTADFSGFQQFWIDFGSSRPLDIIAFVNHNFGEDVDVTVDAGTDTSYADLNIGIQWREWTAFHRFETPVNYRYWRITINDNNPAFGGTTQVGYFMMGLLTKPTFNFRLGWTNGRNFVNRTLSSPYAVPFVDELYRVQQLALEFGPISTADLAVLRTLYTGVKRSAWPLLLLPERNGTDAWFGRLLNVFEPRIGHKKYVNLQFSEDTYGNRREVLV